MPTQTRIALWTLSPTLSAPSVFSFYLLDGLLTLFEQGGNVLGNGTWLNVGGNQAVTWGGLTAQSQTGGAPYDDLDGGQSCVSVCPRRHSLCSPTLLSFPSLFG